MISLRHLILLTNLCAAFVAGASSVVSLGDSFSGRCRFKVDNQEFDLCPVLEGRQAGWTVELENRTPPTITRTEYKISLHGPQTKDQSVPDDEQCPEGTWICKTKSYRPLKSPDDPPHVLEVVPVAGEITYQSGSQHSEIKPSAQMGPSRENAHHDILHIRLHGGYYVGQRQTADLQFTCDHSAEEPTAPSYYYSWNGTHAFQWRTKHACGLNPTATSPEDSPPDDNGDNTDTDEPPADEPENETDLLTPVSKHPKRSTILIFLSSIAIVSIIGYVVYRPPRPLRQRAMAFLKSRPWLLRFRVGENVLVRWAEEDIELLDGEEDVMVNGDGESIFFADEESIPLKPSPRRGRILSYGSAL